MKKRVLSLLLILCMVLATLPMTVFAASVINREYYKLKASSTGGVYETGTTNGGNHNVTFDGSNGEDVGLTLLNSLLQLSLVEKRSPSGHTELIPVTFALDPSKPFVITDQSYITHTETFTKKVIIAPTSARSTIEAQKLDETAYVIYNDSEEGVTLQKTRSDSTMYNATYIFEHGLEILPGAKLTLRNMANSYFINFVFNGDVVVDGSLVMIGDDVGRWPTATFGANSSVIINQGATCELGGYTYSGGNVDEALIQNAGTLTISGPTMNHVVLTAAGTAVSNTGDLTIIRSAFSNTDASKPLIVNSGAMTIKSATKEENEWDEYVELKLTAAGTAIQNTGSVTLHNGTISTSSATAPVIDMQSGSLTLGQPKSDAETLALNLTVQNDAATADTPVVTLAAGTTYTAADGTTTTLTNGGTITKDDTATEPGGSGLVVTPNPEPEPEPEPEKPVQKPVVFPGILGDLPFTDVAFNADFFEAVQYVYASGLMMGTAPDKFAPNATLTRAMIWTVLARMSGVDTETDANQPWWAKARTWAMEQGITDGTYPERAVTRLELVTMLWRFYNSPGAAVDVTGVGNVPDWGLEALRWAAQYGLIDVAGWSQPATRAETAVAIYKA